jgi:hypothetical protein
MLIGFNEDEVDTLRPQIERLVRDLGESHDAITTSIPAITKWCDRDKRAPYLLVRNTKLSRARRIAEEIHRVLDIDVEYEKIGGFIAQI